ncbi:MAG: nucleotidyltransferase domain-containing protein [archaeon]
MNSKENDIPEMNLNNQYSPKKPVIPEDTGEMQKEMDKKKKELEKLKNFIVKKYPFIQAVGIIPPQVVKEFVKEEIGESVAESEDMKKLSKKMHVNVIIPEEQFKNISKIRKEIVGFIDKEKQDVWIYLKTPVDVFEACLDSKFEFARGIALSFPIYDKGFLGALRVAEIHKSLILQKFEKYVVSYIIAGSLVRGEAVKTSDVDVAVIIDDTDVKRMPRLELKERLRSFVYQYVSEAEALAGVKNKLSPQVYLLTDFWESVKDANPIMFTFIRDGIPLHDRGTFTPWKSLLKMGKLKPSPEAIDMFMKSADKTKEMAQRRLIDAMIDIYYGVLTPSQALIMLNGSPPPTHKETPKIMNQIFVEKEKMLKKSEIKVLEQAVKNFKDYEHDSKYTIKGAEIDKLISDSETYVKRLKELRSQIEKRYNERTIEQIYKDIFDLLKSIVGSKTQEKILQEFEKDFVKKGKFTQQHLRILRSIINARAEFKKGKSNSHKINEARKDAVILINDLIDYSQRCDLVSLEKGRMRLKYKEKNNDAFAELMICGGAVFLFRNNAVKKLTDRIQESDMNEVSDAVAKQKEAKEVEINPKVFELLKKEIGEYEIIL